MKPLNQSFSKSDLLVSSNTVVWQGPDIPCIELCTGDTVSTVVAKIAEHMCKMVSDLEDLKTLTFECLLDCPNNCDPKDYSLKAIIQLLLDNDCKLQDLINSVLNQVNSGNIPLSLDLKCLVPYLHALLISENDFTLNDLLQSFINIMCDHETSISDILTRIQSLEVLIKNFENIVISGSYIEPSITSCLYPSPLLHSQLTELIANYVCDIRSDIGSNTDIISTLTSECLSDYLNNPNIIQNPTSLAQDNYNKWVIICDLLSRIKTIEQTCCTSSCEDIHIGYSTFYDEVTKKLTLTFSSSAGTSIPIGFNDCGATIELRDSFNNFISLPIPNLGNGTVWTSPILSLDFTNPIDAVINTCFSNPITGLKCIDAFNQTIPAQEIGCKICKICAVNGNDGDQISVTYTTLSNASPTTIILEKDGCISFELPSDKPIISNVTLITSGSSISLLKSGDCTLDITIPPTVNPSCWFFRVPLDKNAHCYLVTSTTSDDVSLDMLPSPVVANQYNKYSSINTTLGSFSLSGNTVINTVGCTGNCIDQNPLLPVGLPLSIVNNSNICSSSYSIGMISGNSSGTFLEGTEICQYTTMSGQVGFYLEIIGQNTDTPPEISIINENGVITWIKGEINNCNCI